MTMAKTKQTPNSRTSYSMEDGAPAVLPSMGELWDIYKTWANPHAASKGAMPPGGMPNPSAILGNSGANIPPPEPGFFANPTAEQLGWFGTNSPVPQGETIQPDPTMARVTAPEMASRQMSPGQESYMQQFMKAPPPPSAAPQSAPGGRSLLDLYRANMNNGRQSVQARDADRFGVNR